MPKSELYGNLEMPGFKGFPSSNFTKLLGNENNLNPDQGVFEIKQALVRHKLSNGRAWNHPDMALPRDTEDKFPHFHLGEAFKLSAAAGALDSKVKATNPEMITGFGMLPAYPEEERIKGMLNMPQKLGRESVMAKEIKQYEPEVEIYGMKDMFHEKREKFSAERLNRLADLGFSEELIGKAIEEEAKRDIIKALQSPGLYNEAAVSSAIEETYEKWVTKRNMRKTGENASGIGAGSSVQNAGVTAYSAAASIADVSLPPSRTGADRIRAELRREEKKATATHNYEGLSETPSGNTSVAQVLSGMAARVGTGPGGNSTFAEAGIQGVEASKRGKGRPLGFRESEETKAKRSATAAVKRATGQAPSFPAKVINPFTGEEEEPYKTKRLEAIAASKAAQERSRKK